MFASVVLFLAWVHYASAIATANCTVSSDMWMYNSLDQSPCRVAEFLSYPCNAWIVVPLSNGSEWYEGAANNPCECNTVMYNLLTACSMCQGGSQQGWQVYSQNCSSQRYIGQYPEDILSTTAVPHWAYIDITGTGLLDLNEAETIGDAPETTKGLVSTSTIIATRTVRVTASASQSSKSSSIAAPIIGGVVGGVAGIALVAVGCLFWISRLKHSRMKMLSQSSVLGSPSLAAGSLGSPSKFSTTSASPRHAAAPTGRIYEPYEPQTQSPSLNTTSFPKPQNNSVSMYVTPSNAYGNESARNNIYRTT